MSKTGGEKTEGTTEVLSKNPNTSPQAGKSRETPLPPPEAPRQKEERWNTVGERRNSHEKDASAGGQEQSGAAPWVPV